MPADVLMDVGRLHAIGLVDVVHGVLATHSSDGGICVSVSGSDRNSMLVNDRVFWVHYACAVGFVLDCFKNFDDKS